MRKYSGEKISHARMLYIISVFVAYHILVGCNMKYFHFVHSSTENRHRAVYLNFILMYFIRHL